MNKYIFLSSLKTAMKKNGHTQENVAYITGIHQSQISKILNRSFSKEDSDAINELKKYSDYNEYVKHHRLTGEIEKAVYEIWDGSAQMEKRIANFIRCVGPELALLNCSDIEQKTPKKATAQSSRS